jgi:hypothetical protein
MIEFKGTKGDWKVKSKISGLETEIFCGKIRVAQAKHFNNGKEGEENYFKNDPLDEEGFANAKLIAAAPVLLKEHLMDLKHLKTWRSELVNAGLMGSILWNEYTDMIDSKEKAINKALN